jgi:hypothetical protein
LAGALRGLFRQAVAAITSRITAPAPAPKKKRSGKDGTEHERTSFIRKHMRRLFRKTGRHMGDDWRSVETAFDSERWRRHRQSVAQIEIKNTPAFAGAGSAEPQRGFLHAEPNYSSPVL